MAEEDLGLGGVKPLIIPARTKPKRTEDCGTCYWSLQTKNGELECHGAPPTCHVLMVPHPVNQNMQRPQPLCVWPPVRPGVDWCRNWKDKRDE